MLTHFCCVVVGKCDTQSQILGSDRREVFKLFNIDWSALTPAYLIVSFKSFARAAAATINYFEFKGFENYLNRDAGYALDRFLLHTER